MSFNKIFNNFIKHNKNNFFYSDNLSLISFYNTIFRVDKKCEVSKYLRNKIRNIELAFNVNNYDLYNQFSCNSIEDSIDMLLNLWIL
ncbi:MAG: hypothetical protein ABF289_06570 [Clostridiales bacterium]